MTSVLHKTLALTLSASLLAAYTPVFATERQVIEAGNSAAFTGDVFENLSVTDYGAAIYNAGTTTVSDATFTGNKTTTRQGENISDQPNIPGWTKGGAVYNTGTFTLSGTNTFENNQAAMFGGAIGNEGGTVSITAGETTFKGNKTGSSTSGGAIANFSGGTVTISDDAVVSFENNVATSFGGAIYQLGEKLQDGTVYYNDSYLNVGSNTTFKNNTASSGGAIAYEGSGTININGATFDSNHADSNDPKNGHGGAIIALKSNMLTLNLNEGTTFKNNTAMQSGGAITYSSSTKLNANGAIFTDNTAGNYGGAIAGTIGSETSEIDIKNSTFEGNTAGQGGGAFDAYAQKITISGSNFTGNKVTNGTTYGGGAILVEVATTIADSTFAENVSNVKGGAIHNTATATVSDSTFTNNTVQNDEGGAIYNAGTLTLAGNTTFSGNMANGAANDIYNKGTLNIDDTTTLDGGIAGTGTVNVNGTLNVANTATQSSLGTGTVNVKGTLNIGQAEVKAGTLAFANGSTLGVEFGNTDMGNIHANTVTIGDGSNLVVALSKDFLTTDKTEHTLINEDANVTGEFTLADVTNALYDVSLADNVVTAQRKSQEEQEKAVEQAGGTSNDVAVTAAFTSSADLGNDTANKVADVINTLAQTDTAALVKATKAVAPEVAPAKQVVHTAVLNEVFGALQHRMADASSASPAMYALDDGKDYHKADAKYFSVWTQGLLNKSHKEATSGADAFTGRSTGVAAGADMKVGESGLAGIGYAYTHSNVSGSGRHDRILGDNFFVYGQYRPSAFWVQGTLAYGDSKYEEEKYLPGLTLDADYHVQHYAAQGRMGYDVTEWMSPSFGVRYTRLHQEGYTDGAQHVAADNSDYFTGMFGIDFQAQKRLSSSVSLLPHLYTGLSYDFYSSDNESRVTLPNSTGYNVAGERLHRLAFEVGAGVTARLCHSVEAVLGYEGSFRQDYNSHTGTLKLRYLF